MPNLKRKREEKHSTKVGAARWRRAPVFKSNGTTYYDQVELEDGKTKLYVGDFCSVLIEKENGKEDLAIAAIESMWETKKGEKCFEARWFVFPEDTKLVKEEELQPFELLETDEVTECSLDSVNAKVKILPQHVFRNLRQSQAAHGRVVEYDDADGTGRGEHSEYFCERFYHSELNVARPSQLLVRSRKPYLYSNRLRDADLAGAGNELLTTNSEGSDDRFASALRLLQLSAIPPSLPCREGERQDVLSFVEDALGRGGGGALYISGMPGTGKTATVHEVVRLLKAQSALGKTGAFDFIEVNGMKLRHPYDAYTLLYKQLTGVHASPQRAGQLLEQMFSSVSPSSPHGRPCVLLVDELDLMVTKKQTVLYNLFDWPSRPQSWLTVIGIANTMDLPERLLPRIHSRMGMTRVVFKTYKAAQLEKIVSTRLENLQVFDEGAVLLCAKKVASVSGDVRRALHICRRAVELCREGGQKLVAMDHIQAASNEAANSPIKRALRALPLLAKLTVIGLYKCLNMQDSEDVAFDKLFRIVSRLWHDFCATNTSPGQYAALHRTQLLETCTRLDAASVFLAAQGPDDRVPTLRLGRELALHDIKSGLEDDPHCSDSLR